MQILCLVPCAKRVRWWWKKIFGKKSPSHQPLSAYQTKSDRRLKKGSDFVRNLSNSFRSPQCSGWRGRATGSPANTRCQCELMYGLVEAKVAIFLCEFWIAKFRLIGEIFVENSNKYGHSENTTKWNERWCFGWWKTRRSPKNWKKVASH